MSDEDLRAELERLKRENEALKKGASKGVSLKVSEKGETAASHAPAGPFASAASKFTTHGRPAAASGGTSVGDATAAAVVRQTIRTDGTRNRAVRPRGDDDMEPGEERAAERSRVPVGCQSGFIRAGGDGGVWKNRANSL